MESGKLNFILGYNKAIHIIIDEAYEEQMEPPRVIRRPRRLQ